MDVIKLLNKKKFSKNNLMYVIYYNLHKYNFTVILSSEAKL